MKKRGEGNEQLQSNVMFYNHFRRTANINVKKLISLNLVLKTRNDTSKTANMKIVNPTRPLPGCP